MPETYLHHPSLGSLRAAAEAAELAHAAAGLASAYGYRLRVRGRAVRLRRRLAGHLAAQAGSGGRTVTALTLARDTGIGYEPAATAGVDRAIRVSTAIAVLAVAGVAAYVSHGTPTPSSASTARPASPPGWSRPRSTGSSTPARW
jgi:hypothetical protein